MIPYKSNLLTAVPQTLEKHLEILDAVRKLAAQYGDDHAPSLKSAAPPPRPERSGPTLRETYPELAALWQWLILKYSPDQPRVAAGNPDGGQWAKGDGGYIGSAREQAHTRGPGTHYAQVFVEGYDETKNPAIDQVTRTLFQALLRAHLLVGEGAGPAYGIRVHSVFAADVKSQDIRGIDGNGVEQSFTLGDVVRYGLDGSIRTDVILRDESGKIIAVYDVKTGSARLKGERVQEIRAHLKIGKDVPIFELHVDRGIIAKIRLYRETASPAYITADFRILERIQ